jgi:hypothetical protein
MSGAVGTTVKTVLGLVLGLVVTVVLGAIYVSLKTPWSNFNLGGHFHPFGGWQGTGTLHSTTGGGDYTMWIQFELSPRPRSGRAPLLRGSAALCSPRGEYLPLNVSADALRGHGGDLTGVPLRVQMNRWSPLLLQGRDRNPQLEFYGTFGDDVLMLEDHGSLGMAFSPDGRLRESPAKTPSNPESTRVTLEKSTLSRLPEGCII